MVDTLTPQERSHRLSLVRSRHTKPELRTRSLLHGNGYRYRLHVNDLPGSPDLVFPSRRKVVFVHGCCWHRHKCKLGDRMPKSRIKFWKPKLQQNQRRDARNRRKLSRMGWGAFVVWECQVQRYSDQQLLQKLINFLEN